MLSAASKLAMFMAVVVDPMGVLKEHSALLRLANTVPSSGLKNTVPSCMVPSGCSSGCAATGEGYCTLAYTTMQDNLVLALPLAWL